MQAPFIDVVKGAAPPLTKLEELLQQVNEEFNILKAENDELYRDLAAFRRGDMLVAPDVGSRSTNARRTINGASHTMMQKSQRSGRRIQPGPASTPALARCASAETLGSALVLPMPGVGMFEEDENRSKTDDGDQEKTQALWPSNIELHPEYAVSKGGGTAARPKNARRSSRNYFFFAQQATTQHWTIIHPESRTAMLFDSLGVAMIVFEVFVTPFILAWGIVTTGIFIPLSYIICLYWLSDLGLSFSTGLYVKGHLIMDRREIAREYLKTWFFADLILLFIDIISIAIRGSHSDNQVLRAAKVCRLLKIFRITRLFRFIEKAMTWSLSNTMRMLIQLCTLMFVILLMNHLLACVWWVLGSTAPSDTGVRWTVFFIDEDLQVSDRTYYEYCTSLHWTVAQMTMGSMDVMPTNSVERCYAMLLLIFALLFGSALISLISGVVVQMAMVRWDRTEKLKQTRRFLQQERIPAYLAAEVQRQVKDRLSQRSPVEEDHIEALDMLSRSLRMELVLATRMPLLLQHSFLRIWSTLDTGALKALCQDGVSLKYLRTEDDLFLMCESAIGCYQVVEGEMLYVQHPSGANVEAEVVMEVKEKAWLAEAALWCQWRHVGNCAAQRLTKVLAVNALAVSVVVSERPCVQYPTMTYAKNYHQRVVLAIPPNAPWPSDLYVPNTDTSDLMSSELDLDLLRMSLAKGITKLTAVEKDRLETELKKGQCCLQLTETNKLVRTVAVVALSLQRWSGDILVRVGVWNVSGFKAACKLPGTKRSRGELPQAAIGRLIKEDFVAFENNITPISFKTNTERAVCKKYVIDTIYLRSVLEATIALEEPDLPVAIFHPELFPASAQFALGELANRDVIMLPDNKEVLLYAWMSAAHFEKLRHPDMNVHLLAWLNSLEVWQGLVEA